MKKTFLLLLMASQVSLAWGQFPISFKRKVNALPKTFERPMRNIHLDHTGKRTGSPWIVFSDREDNFTTTEPGGSVQMKKLSFMEPFYVLDEKKGYIKLIKYDAELLRGRKVKDVRKAQSFGWISRWKLLMWNRSYTEGQSGYPEKSIAIVNGYMPLSSPDTYYDITDSAFVYSSPELKKSISKVKLHQINYIFKKSEDGRKYLIGNDDKLVADSAKKVILGWIAADAVHNWGNRLFISPLKFDQGSSLDSASMLLSHEVADPMLNSDEVLLKSVPVLPNVPGEGLLVGNATDVYDKSNNALISINGKPIKYSDYVDLRSNIRNVNVVFVIDGGSPMSGYFPGLTNTLQSFENLFKEYGKTNEFRYGAVVYRDNDNCATARGISSTMNVSPDYRRLMEFLINEGGKTRLCNQNIVPQPLHQGITAALEMLKQHVNQTNLIVLIGSTGDATPKSPGLSEDFSAHNARLLAIQAYSEKYEWYNNFVLQAKTLVSEAAVFSADRKKAILINGDGLAGRQAYNTTHQDSISFYLDYPANSLIQGGVVFPTKGSVSTSKSMRIALNRFLRETDLDVSSQLTALDSAFRKSGISNSNLSTKVKGSLKHAIGENLADRMPHNGFKYYITNILEENVVENHSTLLRYSIILNSSEYREFNDVLALMAGQNLESGARSFRRDLVRGYIDISKKMLAMPYSSRTIKDMTLSGYLKSVTGLPLRTDLLEKFKVRSLGNPREMKDNEFRQYLEFLSASAESIKIATQVGQQFTSNGKIYYYIFPDNFKTNLTKDDIENGQYK